MSSREITKESLTDLLQDLNVDLLEIPVTQELVEYANMGMYDELYDLYETVNQEFYVETKDFFTTCRNNMATVEELIEARDFEGIRKHFSYRFLNDLHHMEVTAASLDDFCVEQVKYIIQSYKDSFGNDNEETPMTTSTTSAYAFDDEDKAYIDNFLKKYDAGEEFSEEELQKLVSFSYYASKRGCFYKELPSDEDGRWTRSIITLFEFNGRYFAVSWDKGLTECQEHEYRWQPDEVFLEETQVVKTLVTVRNKKDGQTYVNFLKDEDDE